MNRLSLRPSEKSEILAGAYKLSDYEIEATVNSTVVFFMRYFVFSFQEVISNIFSYLCTPFQEKWVPRAENV